MSPAFSVLVTEFALPALEIACDPRVLDASVGIDVRVLVGISRCPINTSSSLENTSVQLAYRHVRDEDLLPRAPVRGAIRCGRVTRASAATQRERGSRRQPPDAAAQDDDGGDKHNRSEDAALIASRYEHTLRDHAGHSERAVLVHSCCGPTSPRLLRGWVILRR